MDRHDRCRKKRQHKLRRKEALNNVKVSLKTSKREYVFAWPKCLPDKEQIRVVCVTPERTLRKRIESEMSEQVTDLDEKVVTSRFRAEKDVDLIKASVVRIENLEDADTGQPINRPEKIFWLMQENLGLDFETHGWFENEFTIWFNKNIMRRIFDDSAKKNSLSSPTQPTDISTENPTAPATTA